MRQFESSCSSRSQPTSLLSSSPSSLRWRPLLKCLSCLLVPSFLLDWYHHGYIHCAHVGYIFYIYDSKLDKVGAPSFLVNMYRQIVIHSTYQIICCANDSRFTISPLGAAFSYLVPMFTYHPCIYCWFGILWELTVHFFCWMTRWTENIVYSKYGMYELLKSWCSDYWSTIFLSS